MNRLHYNLSYTTYSTIRFLMDRFLAKVRARELSLDKMVNRQPFALKTIERNKCPVGLITKASDDDPTIDTFTWILDISTPEECLVQIYFNRVGDCRVDQKTDGWSWAQEELVSLLISYVEGY